MTMSVVGGQPKKGTQIIKQLLRLGSLLAFFAPLVSHEVFLIFKLLYAGVSLCFCERICLRNVNKLS